MSKKNQFHLRVISFIYRKNFLKIFLKLILTETMRHSHQKNYSTALRKLTASAIGSVLYLFFLININYEIAFDKYRSSML